MVYKILRTPQAAQYIGLAGSTLEKMRLRSDGIPFIRLGKRAVGYRLEDLDAWLEKQCRLSTSDQGGSHAA